MKLTEIKTHEDMVKSIESSAAGLAWIQTHQRVQAERATGNPNGSSLPAEYGTN
jgi:hypothetical protein